jgi:hypothetical protein
MEEALLDEKRGVSVYLLDEKRGVSCCLVDEKRGVCHVGLMCRSFERMRLAFRSW